MQKKKFKNFFFFAQLGNIALHGRQPVTLHYTVWCNSYRKLTFTPVMTILYVILYLYTFHFGTHIITVWPPSELTIRSSQFQATCCLICSAMLIKLRCYRTTNHVCVRVLCFMSVSHSYCACFSKQRYKKPWSYRAPRRVFSYKRILHSFWTTRDTKPCCCRRNSNSAEMMPGFPTILIPWPVYEFLKQPDKCDKAGRFKLQTYGGADTMCFRITHKQVSIKYVSLYAATTRGKNFMLVRVVVVHCWDEVATSWRRKPNSRIGSCTCNWSLQIWFCASCPSSDSVGADFGAQAVSYSSYIRIQYTAKTDGDRAGLEPNCGR